MTSVELRRLAAHIKWMIESSPYSPSEVARHVGVDRSAVSRWMGGTRTPTMQNLLDLAALLEVSVREMWGTPEQRRITAEQSAMVQEMAALDAGQQRALLNLAHAMRKH